MQLALEDIETTIAEQDAQEAHPVPWRRRIELDTNICGKKYCPAWIALSVPAGHRTG
jgi:hypothetical protein